MKTIKLATLLLVLAVSINFAQAGVVKKVAKKGSKKLVLIKLDGESVQKKDILLAEKNGRPTGLIYVMKTKGNMAYGVIAKGKVQVGATTKPYNKKKTAKKSKHMAPVDRKQKKGTFKNFLYGDDVFYSVMFGSASNTMSVKDTSGDKSDVTGSGMNFKFNYDYPLLESIWVRAGIGYHDFAAENSTSTCGDDSLPCASTIKYLVMDLTGRLMFSTGAFRPWVGVILGAYVPLSQDDTTAVKQESVTNTSTYGAALGFDWKINNNWMIPIQAEYNVFPASPNVTANTIAYRLGLGYSF